WLASMRWKASLSSSSSSSKRPTTTRWPRPRATSAARWLKSMPWVSIRPPWPLALYQSKMVPSAHPTSSTRMGPVGASTRARTSSSVAPQSVQGRSAVCTVDPPGGPAPELDAPGRSAQGRDVARERTDVASAQQALGCPAGGREAALHLGEVLGGYAREQVVL